MSQILGTRKVLQRYKDIFAHQNDTDEKLEQLILERDQLIIEFDNQLGRLRLPMRLRRRSGGQLMWRNVAKRSANQRDRSLSEYQEQLIRLPEPVQQQLRNIEKKRLFINYNLSTLQHEKSQLAKLSTHHGQNTNRAELIITVNSAQLVSFPPLFCTKPFRFRIWFPAALRSAF